MLEAITKLLILQDRDRKILSLQEELARIAPDRQELQGRAVAVQAALDAAKTQVKHLESERKRLELEVESKKQLIERYSLQQFQTKRNDEYRALAHEIETCKNAIVQLEDQQLELMEQGEAAQRVASSKTAELGSLKRTVDARVADLNAREETLAKELEELQTNRGELAEAVEPGVRSRYERLLWSKGQNVVVGISHGVCGGCHMTLSRQTVVSCCAEQEIIFCPNCGRILYYTPEMDLAVIE